MTRKFEVGARVKVLDTCDYASIRGYVGTIKAQGDTMVDWDVIIDDDPDENPNVPWDLPEKDLILWYPDDARDTETTVNLDREFLREVLDELEPGTDAWTRLDAIVNAPVTQKFEVTVTHQDPMRYMQNMLSRDGVQVEISRIEG